MEQNNRNFYQLVAFFIWFFGLCVSNVFFIAFINRRDHTKRVPTIDLPIGQTELPRLNLQLRKSWDSLIWFKTLLLDCSVGSLNFLFPTDFDKTHITTWIKKLKAVFLAEINVIFYLNICFAICFTQHLILYFDWKRPYHKKIDNANNLWK